MQYLNRKQTAKDLGAAIISSCPKNTHLGRNGINTLGGGGGGENTASKQIQASSGSELSSQAALHRASEDQQH